MLAVSAPKGASASLVSWHHFRGNLVRFGTLDVPARSAGVFAQATSYLSGDSVMRGVIDKAEHASRPVHVRINSHGDDSYDPNTRTVHWDPHSALATSEGGRQSPALGLGHELDHATAAYRLRNRGSATLDARYDDAEERRVIRGAERHAARALGEDVRYDHAGTLYRVSSPVAR
jgi:hypothetical protein